MRQRGIAKEHFRRLAAVDLQGDVAFQFTFGVVQSRGDFAINGRPDAMIHGKDFVTVPFAGFDRFQSAGVGVE